MLLEHATPTDTCVGRKKNKDLKKEVRELREKNVGVEAENKLLINEMDKKDNQDAASHLEDDGDAEARLKQKDNEVSQMKSTIAELQGKFDLSDGEVAHLTAKLEELTNRQNKTMCMRVGWLIGDVVGMQG